MCVYYSTRTKQGAFVPPPPLLFFLLCDGKSVWEGTVCRPFFGTILQTMNGAAAVASPSFFFFFFEKMPHIRTDEWPYRTGGGVTPLLSASVPIDHVVTQYR